MKQGLECRALGLVRQTPRGETRVILREVSARFEPGTLSLIRGPIGAGKTSLLHLLSALLRPTTGEVLADGEPVSRYIAAHRDRWRRQAGLVFQGAHFLDGLSVIENVMAPLVPRGSSLSRMHRRGMDELERLGIGSLAQRSLAGLSGGERQRVSLARALVGDPRYLFADEPSAHQDAEGMDLIVSRLRHVRASGAVVVVVSHDPRFLEAGVADTRWTLVNGSLEPDGPP